MNKETLKPEETLAGLDPKPNKSVEDVVEEFVQNFVEPIIPVSFVMWFKPILTTLLKQERDKAQSELGHLYTEKRVQVETEEAYAAGHFAGREAGFDLGMDKKFQDDRVQKGYDKGFQAGREAALVELKGILNKLPSPEPQAQAERKAVIELIDLLLSHKLT